MSEARHHYRDYAGLLGQVSLPAAMINLDLLTSNAREVLRRGGRHPVRIGTKSVRCRAVLRRLLALDARYQGLLCYSAREAVFLAKDGFDDLLVAYPTLQPADILAVCECLQNGHRITLMVDDARQLEAIERVAARHDVVVPLCMDLDMSVHFPGIYFGVRRSPVRDVATALALWHQIRTRRHLRLDGVMGYEAQISGVADAVPGQRLRNTLVRCLKRVSIPRLARRRQAVASALRDAGAELRFINGGGTGSLESTCRDASVTELTAGSAFYAPVAFDHYRDFRHQPAAFFALEVSRQPQPRIITCNGGGYIASGSQPAAPVPFLPAGLSLLPHEGAGEVQTPLHASGEIPLPGAPVFFRHAKAGEICERFDHLLLVAGGEVVERAPTYRGDGQCFF